MRIGPYRLRNNLVLAPMAGVTDRPFRQLCRRFGAGLAVSEMVSSNSLLWGSEKTKRRADHRGEDAPRSVQLLGTDPAMMAEAGRYNVANGCCATSRWSRASCRRWSRRSTCRSP